MSDQGTIHVVEQIGAILCNNRTKCGKSMKFGTV